MMNFKSVSCVTMISGRSRIFQKGASTGGRGANLLFGIIFIENCMKMKKRTEGASAIP